MTDAERASLVEALRTMASAAMRALAVLEGAASVAPVAVTELAPAGEDAAARQRRLKAERQRRWRAKKAAETVSPSTVPSTVPSTEATTDPSTPSTAASTESSTQTHDFPSRACARSSSEEEKNSEKNKNPLTPKGGETETVREMSTPAETLTLTAEPLKASTPAKPARRSPNAVVDAAALADPGVRRVWQAYATAVGTRVALTGARVDLIRQRLSEGWSVDDLESCMRGYATSKWHFGENERGRRYTDIELWLRDARRIEQGMSLTANKPKAKAEPLGGIEAKWERFFAENPEADGAAQWHF